MTLTPTIAAQLRRLSELTGSSQASLISELLEGQEMVFDRVIQALEAAALVKEEMKSSLREDLDRSQQVIEAQLGLVLESLDNAAAPLLKEAEKIRRRKGRVTGGGQAERRTPDRLAGLVSVSTTCTNFFVLQKQKNVVQFCKTELQI